MKVPLALEANSRALLTFHHILSSQKKRIIRHSARELNLTGICKIGYPGVLAVEGREAQVGRYVREIKSLRWASCTLADLTTGLSDADMQMSKAVSAESHPSRSKSDSELGSERGSTAKSAGIVMVEKMNEVGTYMQRAGLEEWWRRAMGYAKGG
ncbi:hypothetical protein DFH11DRAFT_1031937 [Phellopilus nigrolimitatus]|nr:hypothetical protein DFH11DRAFT_1031937 [Phellopilus nigrolimitatus]